MESQRLIDYNTPLLEEVYTYGIVEHSFPLNFFLREWYLGSDFYQVVKVVDIVDTFRFQEQSPFDKK